MIKEGVVLGKRYEIGERIGAGGMADVYRARDQKLNRYVAVKVLKREYREDESFVKKFQTEAQSAAGLMHPNVVNVYDVGVDRGLYYIVMELVDGITLKDYIEKKGRLSAKEVISIAIQICAGIDAAHQKQIIHRDIKPQNVIISKEGKVKVTDFGIAKAATSHTVSTTVLGSVHYTSPEQARGGFSDVKSDIYSTGITLYEMVTGQVPFDGESAVSVAVKHLNEAIVPPSELAPDVPYSLEQIILKCTQKTPDLRYPNMTALIADLKRSLIDPEGNFVMIGSNGLGDTTMASAEEIERIKRQASYDTVSGYDTGEYDDDEYDDDGYESGGYHDDGYDDEDDYDEDDRRAAVRSRKKKGEEVNPGMTKIMKILTIVVAVLIAFVLLFLVGKATGLFKFGGTGTENAKEEKDTVKMPDVLGKTKEEAVKALNEAGLGYKTPLKEAESDKYKEGLICGQDVKAGEKVKKNTRIQLTISTGLKGEKITMPDVTNNTEADAVAALVAAGIKESNITPQLTEDDSVAEGRVIKSNPAAGAETTKDATVTLYISKGKGKVEVPGLVGKDVDTAVKLLNNNGLAPNATEEYSNKPQGQVISQGIDAGTKVEKGTVVDIIVSKGERPKAKPTVPDIIGNSEANVRNALSNAGLMMVVGDRQYNSQFEAGCIITSDPLPGTEVEEGSTVTVIISKGPEPTAPDPGEDSGTDTGNNGNQKPEE